MLKYVDFGWHFSADFYDAMTILSKKYLCLILVPDFVASS